VFSDAVPELEVLLEHCAEGEGDRFKEDVGCWRGGSVEGLELLGILQFETDATCEAC
jgi:hypothetical protein